MIFVIGVMLLAAGYTALWLVRNETALWLGRVSPILILTGYIAVFASVLAGDDASKRNQNNDRDS